VGTVAGTAGDMDNVHMAYVWVQPKEDEVETMALQNTDKEDVVSPADMDILGLPVDRKHKHLDKDQTR